MASIEQIAGSFLARALCVLIASAAVTCGGSAQEIAKPSGPATVRLAAEQQRKEGDLFFADGKVEIHYRNLLLRADHVQYNAKTYMAAARGNVTLDVETQHLSADSAEFNVGTGVGRFEHVRGEIMAEHRPNAYVLVSPNPLIFEAQEVRRLDARTLQGKLLDEAGVATVAGTSFGEFGEGYLRFSYANSHEAIMEAIERIRQFLGNLPARDMAK